MEDKLFSFFLLFQQFFYELFKKNPNYEVKYECYLDEF